MQIIVVDRYIKLKLVLFFALTLLYFLLGVTMSVCIWSLLVTAIRCCKKSSWDKRRWQNIIIFSSLCKFRVLTVKKLGHLDLFDQPDDGWSMSRSFSMTTCDEFRNFLLSSSQMFVALMAAFVVAYAMPNEESIIGEQSNADNFHPQDDQDFFKLKKFKKLLFKG